MIYANDFIYSSLVNNNYNDICNIVDVSYRTLPTFFEWDTWEEGEELRDLLNYRYTDDIVTTYAFDSWYAASAQFGVGYTYALYINEDSILFYNPKTNIAYSLKVGSVHVNMDPFYIYDVISLKGVACGIYTIELKHHKLF